jgi:hypothetical protein
MKKPIYTDDETADEKADELLDMLDRMNALYERKSLWQRLKERFFPPKEEEPDPQDAAEATMLDIQLEVAAVLLASLAPNVWVIRDSDESMPGYSEFLVSGVQAKDHDDGSYTIYVGVKDRGEHSAEAYYPLTDFLTLFMPVDELSFKDYHA